ncbi:MAG: hypothetical protein HXN51_09165, partial [Prevotella nanceiensis]|nr:hypothetical protein [Hoylesella nanceiensis]
NIDEQTSQSGVLKALLLKDKSSLIAIEKQANRLALKSVLTFQNEWNEKGEKVARGSGRRDRKKEAKWKEQTTELY